MSLSALGSDGVISTCGKREGVPGAWQKAVKGDEARDNAEQRDVALPIFGAHHP